MSDAGEDTAERPKNRLSQLRRELALESALECLRRAGATVDMRERNSMYHVQISFNERTENPDENYNSYK